MKNDFLTKLADLCEEYGAVFYYTRDDDGIHIDLNEEEIFIDHHCCNPNELASSLRAARDFPVVRKP